MQRQEMVDLPRLGANTATERYQSHYGLGTISDRRLDTSDAGWTIPQGGPGVVSTITRGPTGVGAAFSFNEPVGKSWHAYETGAAAPLAARPKGA